MEQHVDAIGGQGGLGGSKVDTWMAEGFVEVGFDVRTYALGLQEVVVECTAA